MKKRIAVTGMGVVSCLGNDVDEYYEKLLQGTSGAKTITRFPVDEFPTRFAASIENFDPGELVEKKLARRADPFILYTLVAGKKAVQQANLPDTVDKSRVGVLIGSGMGGMSVYNDGAITLKEKGIRRLTPFFVPYILTNMGGGLLAMEYGFMGPNYSISTACATSNNAIISAASHIRSGEADIMVCGGVEAPILSLGVAGFCACKALSERNEAPEKASRPWDKGRDGFVIGEGAGILVLEEWEHAKKRGALILAEYLGGGMSCDAYHMTDPRPEGEGVELCIRKALSDAGVTSENVDYINAHATSTPAGDMAEIRAMHKIFKNPEAQVVNGTKSMIGHALGAAGGLEAIAVLKALQTGIVHPTINLENPEEDLRFHAPTKALTCHPKIALSNSFGFGGHNASILFAKAS